MQPIIIKLLPKKDSDDKTFYIGKLKSKIDLNFEDGQSFFVYLEDNSGQLHIVPFRDYKDEKFEYKPNQNTDRVTSNHKNTTIYLNKCDNYYCGTLIFDGKMTIDGEAVFLIFVSDSGDEELQISFPEKVPEKSSKRPKRQNRN